MRLLLAIAGTKDSFRLYQTEANFLITKATLQLGWVLTPPVFSGILLISHLSSLLFSGSFLLALTFQNIPPILK
jgi:hypothetical protein